MGRWYGTTARWKPGVLGVGILLLVAACSGDESGSFRGMSANLVSGGDGGSPATTMAAGEASNDGSVEPGGGGNEGDESGDDEMGSGGVTPVALPTQIGRDIIFTAEMTVAVTDVIGAGEAATREIQRLGGFLFGQHTMGSPDPMSVLTFKIRPEDFQAALTALGSIGEVRNQSVNASDVTERIVDLESRVATASASVDRLRALLAEATDIESIVALESELLVRETELETLRGSLRTLQDQVALATIVVSLTEAASNPELALTVSAYPAHDSGQSCPGDGDLQVETGTDTTICFEMSNVGDTWLTDFELRDPVLDIALDDLTVVFGDPGMPLEPGDSLLLALEVAPDRDLRTRTTVTAKPVDENAESIPGRPASQTSTAFVDAIDPGGIASFADGLSASWDVLVKMTQLVVLALGALIPFIWIPILAWFVWRWRRPLRTDESRVS